MHFRSLRWTVVLLKLAVVNQYPLQTGHYSSTLTITACIALQRVNRFPCTWTLGYRKELTTSLPVVWGSGSLKTWCWRRREQCHASVSAVSLASEACVFIWRRLWEVPFSKQRVHIWQECGLISFSQRWKLHLALAGQISLVSVSTLPEPMYWGWDITKICLILDVDVIALLAEYHSWIHCGLDEARHLPEAP